MLDAEEKRELAIKYFKDGYNCAQAVALSFSDIVNIPKDQLLKIASPFGGGMSRLRETCGAVSGMLILAGLLYGYDSPDDDAKTELYKKIQRIAYQFEIDNNSLICRKLLNKPDGHDIPLPSKRTEDFYASRPCARLIGDAAYILAEFINEN